MNPGQVVLMVVSSVVVIGLVGGIAGTPLGLAMHREILTSMGQIATNTRVPAAFYSVLGPVQLAALMLAGVAIAALGARAVGGRRTDQRSASGRVTFASWRAGSQAASTSPTIFIRSQEDGSIHSVGLPLTMSRSS